MFYIFNKHSLEVAYISFTTQGYLQLAFLIQFWTCFYYMNIVQQFLPQDQFFANTPWFTMVNDNKIAMLCTKFQINEDDPLIFIGKCPLYGPIFLTRRTCFLYCCKIPHQTRYEIATLYLIKWISLKMLSINAIEHPFFQYFCNLLDPGYKIPKTKKLRSLIIEYADFVFDNLLKNSISDYFSVFICWNISFSTPFYFHHFIFAIRIYIFQNKNCNYWKHNKYFQFIKKLHWKRSNLKKKIYVICSDNFSPNKSSCKFDNLGYPIFRQYCNCHCSALVLSNLYGPKVKYYKLTQKISLSLQLLFGSFI